MCMQEFSQNRINIHKSMFEVRAVASSVDFKLFTKIVSSVLLCADGALSLRLRF